MIPSLVSTHEGYIVEAPPCIVFMVANVILLAILFTSNRSAKPARGKRPSSPLITPNRSKSPKLHPVPQDHPAQFASTAELNSYGVQHTLANPNEALNPTVLLSIELPEHKEAGSLATPCECSGDGSVPSSDAASDPDKTLIDHDGGNSEQAAGEAAQAPSNDELDKKFDEFINTFFARVRAESRESTV